MRNVIRLVLIGFGNIGRKVFMLTRDSQEFEVVGIVTRDPARVRHDIGDQIPVYGFLDLSWVGSADVAINCGGSAKDLPNSGPWVAERVSCVDSYDTHAHVGGFIEKLTGLPNVGYFRTMDLASKATGHTALVCQGWDPGLFSTIRGIFQSSLGGDIRAYAFYGLSQRGGLSMGHSDAIRQIEGVVDARQFTHAIPEAIDRVRSGENPIFELGEMHRRKCYVTIADDFDKEEIRRQIVTMPDYFQPFETTVEFLSLDELRNRFPDMPHDGLVIAKSENGLMEFRVEWKSNPLATAGILLSCARAAVRMNRAGQFGAFSPLSVPIDLLLPEGTNPLSLV
ncbi:MAG: diaminopimelate dehydrogenase [Candidatus Paceibacterota bacterium]